MDYYIDYNSTIFDILQYPLLREQLSTLWYIAWNVLHLLIYSFTHTFDKHFLSSY